MFFSPIFSSSDHSSSDDDSVTKTSPNTKILYKVARRRSDMLALISGMSYARPGVQRLPKRKQWFCEAQADKVGPERVRKVTKNTHLLVSYNHYK